MLRSFNHPGFAKGLNLRDKFDAVGPDEAIDLLNVEFTTRGQVKQRDGFGALNSSALTNAIDSMSPYYTSAGTKQLVVGCGTRLEALSTGGVVVSSATGLAGGPYSFARFSAPGTELIYAGNGTDTIRSWDGASFAAPTGTVNGSGSSALPKAGVLAVQPTSNRLVATGYGTGTTSGPGGTTSNPSRVHFSNAGDPTTWETDGSGSRGANFVDLTPGDGEQIIGACTYRNDVYIFKETKYFIFFGNNTASTGTPVFNYRTVDTGIGLGSRRGLTVGRDGVYFINRKGIYKTSGGEPEQLSAIIDPFFDGSVNPSYFQSSALSLGSITSASLSFFNERLYAAVPTGSSTSNNRMLVFDPRFNWWSLYDIAASAMTSFRISTTDNFVFGMTSVNKVGVFSSAYTSDNGTAITSRWRSGWNDIGVPVNKTLREVKLWGTGTCVLGTTTDLETTTGTTDTIIFGSGETDTWQAVFYWRAGDYPYEKWGDGTDTNNLWGDGSAGTSDTWGSGTADDLWGPTTQSVVRLVRRAKRGTLYSIQFANSTLNKTWAVARMSLHLREQRFPTLLTTDD